eukprot:Hpha_TRINITY_DN15170_c3_g8::TRINITY_DN15170_c3_g8_i1::g.129058::m.129058
MEQIMDQAATYAEGAIYSAFEGWTPTNWAVYCVVLCVGMGMHGEMMRTPMMGKIFGAMPFKGPVLRNEDLGLSDYGFVLFNKLITCFYVYHSVVFLREAEWITGKREELTLINSLCAVLLALGVYDSIYVPFHRALHLPGLYPLIHKHHHKQINPFRSLYDGINTHPFEFICGEYLHLLSLWVTGQLLAYAGLKFHVAGVVGFLLVTASLAPLNHTRWTMRVPFLFDTRTHDTHHKYPRSNYCQYVPWWDHLYGSFIPYNRDTAAIARSRGVEASTKSA